MFSQRLNLSLIRISYYNGYEHSASHIPMKTPHPLSFVLGLVSGFVVLFVVIGGLRIVGIGTSGTAGASAQGRTGAFSISRMAQRLGMTEADLQKELDSGKTFQQISQEHGVTGGGGRRGTGSGATASGATVPGRTGSGAASVSSSVPVSSSSSHS